MDSTSEECNRQVIMDRIGELEKCINEFKAEMKSELHVLTVQIAENTKVLQGIQKDLGSTVAVELCKLLTLQKRSDSSFLQNTPYGKAMRYPSDEHGQASPSGICESNEYEYEYEEEDEENING